MTLFQRCVPARLRVLITDAIPNSTDKLRFGAKRRIILNCHHICHMLIYLIVVLYMYISNIYKHLNTLNIST